MAKNELSRASGRTEVKRQLKIAAVLVVAMVVLGYAAIPVVHHAVSSPSAVAQAATANRVVAGAAPQAMGHAATAPEEALRSHELRVGTDLADHSRECHPELGVNTACVFN